MQKKRRFEGRTDYKARMDLLKGDSPRIVARITNKQALAQYVISKEAQDFVITAANSNELLGYGLGKEESGKLKSLPACYLTGYLLGAKIKEKGQKEEGIFDIGLKRSTKGGRVYALVKGVADAGIKINYSKEMIPEEARLKGKIDIDKVKQNIDKKFI